MGWCSDACGAANSPDALKREQFGFWFGAGFVLGPMTIFFALWQPAYVLVSACRRIALTPVLRVSPQFAGAGFCGQLVLSVLRAFERRRRAELHC